MVTIPFNKEVMATINVGVNVGINVGVNVGVNDVEKVILEESLSKIFLT